MTALQLIVNADDFGLHPTADESILWCHREGIVTSTSLLVNHILLGSDLDGISYKQAAVKRAMKEGLPVGIHFNLTEGSPTATSQTPHRLIAKESSSTGSSPHQLFLGKFGFRRAVEEATRDEQSYKLLAEEVSAELRAQYERFLLITAGIPPTHADGHQHFHVVDGVAPIVASTLRELDIRWVRIPKEEALLLMNERDVASPRDAFHRTVAQQAERCETTYKDNGLRTTDAFLGLQLMDALQGIEGFLSSVEAVLASFSSSPNSSRSCEVMVHPGCIEPAELRPFDSGCCDLGVDIVNSTLAFCATAGRKSERETLTNQTLVQALKTHPRISLRSFDRATHETT